VKWLNRSLNRYHGVAILAQQARLTGRA